MSIARLSRLETIRSPTLSRHAMANRATILNKSLVMWQVDPSYLSVPMHAQLPKKRMKSISINIIFGSRSDMLCIYRSEVGVRIRWDE